MVLLYAPRALPLFRDGIARAEPLPDGLLQRPAWLFGQGRGLAEGEIFEAIPEGPVDEANHPHLWGMIEDVHAVMNHDDEFRLRMLGYAGHGGVVQGYHTSTSLDAARAFFAKRARVLEVDALLRERLTRSRVSSDDTLRRVDETLRKGPTARRSRDALRDYLHGGGECPVISRTAPPRLDALFEAVSPLGFNEVHLRALDLVARSPALLRRAEAAVALQDPAYDLHYVWRDMLGARGVDEGTLERNALAAWLEGDALHTRAWWLLHRAAEGPRAFLDRCRDEFNEAALHRRLLFASWITWNLPRFRALATELVAEHGARLHEEAIVTILRSRHAARSAELVGAHLGVVVRGRPPEEALRIVRAVEDAARPAADAP